MSGRCGMRNSRGGIDARGGTAARSAAGRTQHVKFEAIAINSVAKKKPTAEDAAHYIGLEHIDPGCFVVSRWGGDVAPIGDKLLMKKGDVLFGRRRAYQRKVAIAPFDGIFSAHGMVLRPKTDVVDEKFFPFFIASDQFMNEAIRISVGGLSPTINWGTLKNCEFDLPPMDEQKKLAELLWAANDLKESYKKAITATDEMLKAKFREMFGDAGDDSSRGGAETRSLTRGRIGDLCNVMNGYAFQSKKYVSSGIRVIRIANVQKGYIEDFAPVFYPISELGNISQYMLEENDLLLSLTGNVGRVALLQREMLPAGLNQRVACLRIIDETILDRNFLFSVMNNDEFERICIEAANGSAQKNMSTEWLKRYEIPLPPLSLQREFVAIADKAESAKANLKKSIAAIDQVMKGLING